MDRSDPLYKDDRTLQHDDRLDDATGSMPTDDSVYAPREGTVPDTTRNDRR
jgi:hypothetical protein